MQLPYFFIKEIPASPGIVVLDEENSRHIVQVLRMKDGEQLWLQNGKGLKALAEISDGHKKHCAVVLKEFYSEPAPKRSVTIAISLLKNASRFEWFLEKATEIGVTRIVPLLCARTESQKFRIDRLKGILVSAMLQSQRLWLPEICEPVDFNKFLEEEFSGEKFIAHCMSEEKRNPLENYRSENSVILIGPEGDFTAGEIDIALRKNFVAASLGDHRLRTETAGVVAATLLCRQF